MTEHPEFRPAGLNDLHALVDLVRQYHAFDGLPFAEGDVREALRALLQDKALGRVWLIAAGPSPVGYVAVTFGFSLEYGGRDAFIDELFLDAAYRGRGWGHAFLQFVEVALREAGVRAMHLQVAHSNVDAKRLYLRFGFEPPARDMLTKRMA